MTKKPNILWITTDQQRYDTLGCCGNPFVNTPNLDRLAAEGVLFDNAFCQSTVCAPSRASFLTGRYPRTTRCRRNGQDIPADEVPVSKLFSNAGYYCGLAGKLHLSASHPGVAPTGEKRIDDGYDEFHWSHDPGRGWGEHNEYIRWLREHNKTGKGPQWKLDSTIFSTKGNAVGAHGPPTNEHHDFWNAETTIRFLRERGPTDTSWFFSMNLFSPHPKFNPPLSYLNRYLDFLDDIPLPNFQEGELRDKPVVQRETFRGKRRNQLPYADITNRQHRLMRAAYWAQIDLIDEQIGRVLDVLEELGEAENTIVVFMSDHGEMLGDHGIYFKGPYFYEGAVRVPLIVSWPGHLEDGRRIAQPVELMEVAPTLLDAAGLSRGTGMQAGSLWSLLTGSDGKRSRDDVYCEYYDACEGAGEWATMIRTDQHKLVRYHGAGEGELYDLTADPYERENLWHLPDYSELKLELLQRLCDRMADTVDPLPEKQAVW
ncbi:MAG: sulfatase [Verrucomicrobiota bacterium]